MKKKEKPVVLQQLFLFFIFIYLHLSSSSSSFLFLLSSFFGFRTTSSPPPSPFFLVKCFPTASSDAIVLVSYASQFLTLQKRTKKKSVAKRIVPPARATADVLFDLVCCSWTNLHHSFFFFFFYFLFGLVSYAHIVICLVSSLFCVFVRLVLVSIFYFFFFDFDFDLHFSLLRTFSFFFR